MAKKLTQWERLDIVEAWCNEYRRRPKHRDEGVYEHYRYLKSHYPKLLDYLRLDRYDAIYSNSHYRDKVALLMEEMTDGQYKIRKESE